MKLQIIPDFKIDNTKILGLVENINFYRNFLKRFKVSSHDKYVNLKLCRQHIITYEILISRNNVSFYLEFDDNIKDNIMTELNICWKNATFTESQPFFLLGKTKELELSEHFFLSLKTDLRGEFPISNLLETQNILRNEEKILIRLEMEPISPSWYREVEECIKHFNGGKVTSKSVLNPKSIGIKAIEKSFDLFYEIVDFGNEMISKTKIKHEYPNFNNYSKLLRRGLSRETKDKSRYNGFKTRFYITTNSKRSNILFRNVLKAFNSMKGDNSFVMVDSCRYKNILCSKEVAQIMQLPTKFYQDTYRINNINNREVSIPKELLNPGILIGTATHKGKEIQTYFSRNKNIRALPKILIGPQNSGKTTDTINFAVDAYNVGDSSVVIDYIQNCELSKAIEKKIPKKDRVIIDVSDHNNIQPFAFTEASKLITESSGPWDRLRIANLLSNQCEYLINSVTLNSSELTPRMLRYLYAACMIVFIHPGRVISDAFQVLRRWEIRNEYIRLAKYSGCFNNDDEVIYDLLELHDRDSKGKIIGTKENLIGGIMDRIIALNKNIYVKHMLKASINYNVDLINYINQGKTILIRIPQTIFPSQQIRDTLATYFTCRLWLAVQLRKQINNRLCHLIIDEVHQIPTCANFIKNHITEFRRHQLGPFFTVHYLKQFRSLLDAVKSAGASYLFLAGTEKENLKMLEDEIKPFTIDDGLTLKPYHSLNVINYGNQYTKFISRLPKPL